MTLEDCYFPKTFCIVQESPADQQHILGLLISIELYSKNATCVVCCTEEVKTFIINFPKQIELTLDFIIIDNEIKLHCLNYIKNILNSLRYCINIYTDCLFVSKDLIMTNAIQISPAVKAQRIGFIKKTTNVASEEKEFMRYSSNILYISDVTYVNKMVTYFETMLLCETLNEYQLDPVDKSIYDAQIEQLIMLNAELPLFIIQQCKLTEFLEMYSYVGTEDFFAFGNSITMDELSKKLSIGDKLISFCGIRVVTADKTIQQLNTHFLRMLINKHILYMSVINLKLSDKKLQLLVPKPHGVGIWDRTNEVNCGLYELVDIFVERYSQYLSKVEADIDYFSFGNYLLTDKPSHIWLNNTVRKYSGFLICNYDKSLKDMLPSLKMANNFLFYYAYSPKCLEDYLNTNVKGDSLIETERSITMAQVTPASVTDLTFNITYLDSNISEEVGFSALLEKLANVKYGAVKYFDMKLIATYLALGVVPVIDTVEESDIYELQENVHYIKSASLTQTTDIYKTIQQNGAKYYKEHINSDACLIKLFNHIFIRNIE